MKQKLLTYETIEVHAIHSEELGPYECKMVEVQLHARNGRLPKHVAVESTADNQLLIPQVLAKDIQADGKLKVPLWNFGLNPIDTQEVCSVVGKATSVDKTVPVKDLLIGELDMPNIVKASKEKEDYLKKNLNIGPQATVAVAAKFRALVTKYHQASGAHPFDLGQTESYKHEIVFSLGQRDSYSTWSR